MLKCRPRLRIVWALALLAPLLAGCGFLPNQVEARDQWQHTYPLQPNGTLEIRGTNGTVDVSIGSDQTVRVTAERVAHGATDEAARQALADIQIHEDVSPNRVALDSETSMSGLFGGSREVNYKVVVPPSTHVVLRTTNGEITARDLDAAFEAHTTNGEIQATGLSDGATVDATNGKITLAFTALSDAGVSVETTNGAVSVTIPKTAHANVNLHVTNGDIDVSGLDVSTTESSRRSLEGTLNGGGPTIRLTTTNGRVSLNGR